MVGRGEKDNNEANLGFECKLWKAADALRNNKQFIAAHGGKLGDISIYGQESTCTTWRSAKMNPTTSGIDTQIGDSSTFRNDRHPDLKADYVLTKPLFLLGVRP